MGFPVPCHVFGDRGLTNFDAKLEGLTVDPGRAPEGIGKAHVTDQLAYFERDLWSAARHLDFHRQNKRNPARCQLMTVAGSTIARVFTMRGAIQYRLAKIRRSKLLKAIRFGDLRRSTLSW